MKTAVQLEIGSRIQVTFLIEMAVDRRLDGDEFRQTSHVPDPKHPPSSKRQVRILRPVTQPTAGFLFAGVADDRHLSSEGTQFTHHDDMRISKTLH